MLVAAMSFTLQWKALTGRGFRLFRDVEHRVFLMAFVLLAGGTAFLVAGGVPDEETVRASAFSTASLLSTTGFATADYNLWADGARVLLLAALVLGGCAGSSAGGAKVVRYVILGRFLGREMRQALHPAAVIPVRWLSQPVVSQVLRAVVGVVTLFALGYVVFGAVLVLLGMDFLAAFTAAVACLNNAGPGLGEVGPLGNYGGLSTPCKWVLSFAMGIGRLEILTVLVVLHPRAWRGVRWKGPVVAGGPDAR
jgi:trk system potassium uptake protein TrkH